jgi:hypothetical protein
VLDPFGGSGSTLIACEKTGRQARLIELDPKYVDVVILRWQKFSGGTATLDGDGRSFEGMSDRRGPAQGPRPPTLEVLDPRVSPSWAADRELRPAAPG